jgi:hypothetical protein
LKKTLIIIVAVFLLTACVVPATESPTITPTETPIPTSTITITPRPTNTATSVPNTPAPVLSALSKSVTFPLKREIGTNNGLLNCDITSVNYEIVNITEDSQKTGTMICSYDGNNISIPMCIYDVPNNELFLWGLKPVKDPFKDHMSQRCEHYYGRYWLGEDLKSIIGVNLSLNIGYPNVNSTTFEANNMGKYFETVLGENAQSLDKFIETGQWIEGQDMVPMLLANVKQ